MSIAKCKTCGKGIMTTKHIEDKKNYVCENCLADEFLKESNAIEGEYSKKAFEDAKQSWIMACLNSKDIKGKDGISYILGIHRRLMKRLNPRIAGKIRKCDVWVGNRKCLDPKEIRLSLQDWCLPPTCPEDEDEETIRQDHIHFEKIHPFEDGNGRTGRILMNIQRLKFELPLLIIHEGEEQQEYYKWFKEDKTPPTKERKR